MAQMFSNDENYNRDFGDSSQLINWVLYSGATCHMTPQLSDFISSSLEDRDKYIEVSDGHHVTAKQKVQVQIRMYKDNGDTFIMALHNVILSSDLCDGLLC